MGMVRQRGRIWWIKWYRDGKPFEESSGSTKRQAAIDLLKMREGDVAKGEIIIPKMNRLRFEEAVDDVINDYTNNGKRSVDHVRRRFKTLTPFFGQRRLAGVTTADVRIYVAKRKEAGAENSTINRELSALKRAFRLALQARKLSVAPHIPLLRETNVRSGFFDLVQFQSVVVKLPSPIQPVVRFAYITGWRVPSEILPLEWRHVDFAGSVVRLDPGTTKNGDGRVFPFTIELRELLDAQRIEADRLKRRGVLCPWVFHRDGDRIKNFRRSWQTACRTAGCPGRLPHDFRRTAVRNMVRRGIPERVAMQMTGHKTRSVFERYNIVSEGDLLEAASRLSGQLVSPPLSPAATN